MSQMPSQNPYAPPQYPTGQMQPPPGSEQFAPCPQCRCPYAKRVGFTLWGGIVGPRLLTHVACAQCGTKYNGKTGQSNLTAIIIYIVVVTGIALAIGLVLGVMSAMS